MAPPPKKFVKTAGGVLKINPEYKKWKASSSGKQKTATTKAQQHPIDMMHVSIRVLQGKDLIAKDRNLLGKRTTSDPFVVVSVTSQDGKSRATLGKTPTIPKNLNPTWNYDLGPRKIPFVGNATSRFVFHIYDEDKMSDPDLMGIVTVPLNWDESSSAQNGGATWFEIPKNSAKNAKGSLQLQIQTSFTRNTGLKSYF